MVFPPAARSALSLVALVASTAMPLTAQQSAPPAPQTNPAAAGQSASGDIPLALFAVPFKGEAPNAGVLVYVEMAPGYFTSWTQAGEARRLGVGVFVNDATTGIVLSEKRHVITTMFGADSLTNLKSQGFRLVTELAVPPGDHELQVSVVDGDGRSGSATTPLEVPDFAGGPLQISGVSLYAWPQRPQLLTAVAEAPMTAVLPWAPTTGREFARGETVALFLEVYEPASDSPPHDIAVTASIRTEDGRTVQQVQQGWSSTVLRGRRGEYGIQLQLPLVNVPPGAYEIRVEARSANDARAERVLPIQVR